MTWSAARVLRESAAWVSPWFPPEADHVDLGWLEFYRLGGAATIMRAVPEVWSPAELVDRVLSELRARPVTEVFWAVHPGRAPGGVDEVLLGLGATVDRRVDICARPAARPLTAGPVHAAVTVQSAETRDDIADYTQASALAWGYPPPSEADIDQAYATLTPGYFTGYWKHTPAGAAGYTLDGEVARLWGAAVVPEFRGCGIYRALTAVRLADAAARGATLALVHAEQATSSPILQRLGFTVYGQQRVLVIRPDAGA
jgi:GNAT superfamily N-acetyltransferase